MGRPLACPHPNRVFLCSSDRNVLGGSQCRAATRMEIKRDLRCRWCSRLVDAHLFVHRVFSFLFLIHDVTGVDKRVADIRVVCVSVRLLVLSDY